ncbi:putative mitochondrial import inner membrane translocase subunit TIM22 [Helianthus annuus]|nr:putative mitochondrial import inner membrane translocase subunit TIM22 [Helianthus annuus]
MDFSQQSVIKNTTTVFLLTDYIYVCYSCMYHVQVLSLCGGYKPLAESFLTSGALQKVQNFAIMACCKESISFVMKNRRGKEDVHTSMVAGFGYGVAISLATGMRGHSIMPVGVICALLNVGMFKVYCKLELIAQEELKNRTKGRFSSLVHVRNSNISTPYLLTCVFVFVGSR